MFPSFAMLFEALLLAGALWLVIKMGGGFPDDLARLRKYYQDYKTGGDPQVLEGMQTEERRRHYRKMCVVEFRTEAVTLGLLWALTFLAGLYAILASVAIVRMIFLGIKEFAR